MLRTFAEQTFSLSVSADSVQQRAKQFSGNFTSPKERFTSWTHCWNNSEQFKTFRNYGSEPFWSGPLWIKATKSVIPRSSFRKMPVLVFEVKIWSQHLKSFQKHLETFESRISNREMANIRQNIRERIFEPVENSEEKTAWMFANEAGQQGEPEETSTKRTWLKIWRIYFQKDYRADSIEWIVSTHSQFEVCKLWLHRFWLIKNLILRSILKRQINTHTQLAFS